MARVYWTESALDDVRDITEFVARDSPAYAARLADRLVKAPRRLAALPRSGAIVPEFGQDAIREVVVRPYRIIYEIRGEDCFVVAVIHGSRDITRLFDPGNLPDI
ncbi:MAG: type II toxin-antitoxin system RelE/ParE family toxin [Isosphaeraceae bacterium]